jgi:hypothetical protein
LLDLRGAKPDRDLNLSDPNLLNLRSEAGAWDPQLSARTGNAHDG